MWRRTAVKPLALIRSRRLALVNPRSAGLPRILILAPPASPGSFTMPPRPLSVSANPLLDA